VVDRADESGREKQAVRLIAQSLPGGDVLVIGRNVDEVGEIARGKLANDPCRRAVERRRQRRTLPLRHSNATVSLDSTRQQS
jgi:hypothetical protein